MSDNLASNTTLEAPAAAVGESSPVSRLNLSAFPKIFVLPTFLSPGKLHEIENSLDDTSASMTYDITEARLILTDVAGARRAKFELRSRGISLEEAKHGERSFQTPNGEALGKRKRESVAVDSSTTRVVQTPATLDPNPVNAIQADERPGPDTAADLLFSDGGRDGTLLDPNMINPGRIFVLELKWLYASIKYGQAQRLEPYLLLSDKITFVKTKTLAAQATQSPMSSLSKGRRSISGADPTISSPLSQATTMTPMTRQAPGYALRRSAGSSLARNLIHETTSEHDEAQSRDLPDAPQWVKENKIYACERPTPPYSPNGTFLELLKKIKLVRILKLDEIGVRAYSTSIASIAAYPYPLTDAREILALPGCETKIAHLFREYQSSGEIAIAKEVDEDEALKVINTFYNIWGVGAKTARDFYYQRGWKDTDDIIEQGWNSLPRQQQIGLKYYDEFEQKISRSEVEYIASIVTYHAKHLVDGDISCIVVGGYRRGKLESGDVDIIISHPKTSATLFLIRRLVKALEKSQWITHTLTLSEINSARGQQPLELKSPGARGGGFDTLDKALVVWQNPNWATKESDLADNPEVKNTNVHRRVDIIISPWRTVGCAVAGWSSGTTFQRDLRRYVKHAHGWKFDSSGVRDRSTGKWQDLEMWSDEETRARTWEEAERRVFEGLGLEWREPELRCTG